MGFDDVLRAYFMTFANKPILVFWETTRACPLSCVHCRADAIENALPGELTTDEGKGLVDQIAAFGKPAPLIILTGGDPLKRRDIYDLMGYAKSKGIGVALSPAVSDSLTLDVLERIKAAGVSSISVSLDGAVKETHDEIRKVNGTYDRTIETIRSSLEIGLSIQVNTAVMRQNIREIPRIFELLSGLGVKTWEVFFLIKTGRGMDVIDISAEESESVCNFLYDASKYGMIIRTVEAPFIRRVAKQRSENGDYWKGDVYQNMRLELASSNGMPTGQSTIRPVGTLDGDGIIFVAYDGTISPGGFLPFPAGNVKADNIVDVYTKNDVFVGIRNRKFGGACGVCAFKKECGGSRARSYAYDGNPLGSDPACLHAKTMFE